MINGTYINGELWIRCPVCGDSRTDTNKAHFSVNSLGLYHCLRCKVGGKLKLNQLLRIFEGAQLQLGDLITTEAPLAYTFDQLIPGAAVTRYSYLERFHTPSGKDVFLSYTGEREIVGLALVGDNQKRMMGRKALGWNQAGDCLTSSVTNPLVLVEGPYDVVSSNHVCTFGLPDLRSIQRELLGQYLILCPDGDVWADRRKIWSLIRVTRNNPLVLGVYVLPEDKDPDEVPENDRRFVDRRGVLKACENYNKVGRFSL